MGQPQEEVLARRPQRFLAQQEIGDKVSEEEEQKRRERRRTPCWMGQQEVFDSRRRVQTQLGLQELQGEVGAAGR